MRLGKSSVVALVFAVLGLHAVAEPWSARAQSDNPVSTVLAVGHLASVVDMPLYVRLYRVYLPAARRASYRGASAMLYDVSGAPAMGINGAAAQPLAEGAGAFIAAGQTATISASESEPADLLLFVLTARPNQLPPLDRPAGVKELFRTPDPLPDLRAGPYEFSLARLTFPAGMQANPAHYRSGAALDYVLAGTGAVTADGKTEAMTAEMPLFERFGWVHRLANPGGVPLVLLQANISREGDPAVHPVAEK
jgi:mannose-6-phosphate isomerase-like protein (cupin superfamily)